MSRFRSLKTRFYALCSAPDWMSSFESMLSDRKTLQESVNALLALLPRPECRLQAACGIGLALSRLSGADMEKARIIMRRLMWSLNEESGNLGWGVPEAMGAALAMSPALAGEYARIFLSYGYETGREDNFLDHAPLRRGVYLGAAMLAAANFAAARPLLPHLPKALADPDALIRAAAALTLRRLAETAPAAEFSGQGRADWQKALEAARTAASPDAGHGILEYVAEGRIVSAPGNALLAQALATVEHRLAV